MNKIVQFLIAEYGVSKKDIQKCLKQTSKEHKKTKKEVGEIILKARVNRLDLLPHELLLKIMTEMDYSTLTLFCSVSKTMKSICEDEPFWKGKLALDFPGAEKLPEKTWRETYSEFSTPGLSDVGAMLLQGINVEKKKDKIEYGDAIVGYGPFPIRYQQYVKGSGGRCYSNDADGKVPAGPITLQQMRDILAKLYDEIKEENQFGFDVITSEHGPPYEEKDGTWVVTHNYAVMRDDSDDDSDDEW